MPAYVSNKGRFKSIAGVVSTPKPKADGYARVQIHKKHYSVHRLVASAFGLPRLKGQDFVNHKNKHKGDNRPENLEWCTHSENIRHSYSEGYRKSSAPKQSIPLRGRKQGTDEWMTFTSAHDASRSLKLQQGNISACLCGRQKQTGGYEFESLNAWTTLDGEEWKPTIGGYAISSFGRIRTQTDVEYTPHPRQDGQCSVKIQGKDYLVHILVAQTFLPPPQEGQTEINHKDLDPSNNCVDNLEWCSKSENIKHSYATNVNRASSATRTSKPVKGRKDGKWVAYSSVMEAARILGVKSGNISNACRKGWKVQGYEFIFDEPTEPELLDGEVWMEVDVSKL